MCMVKARAVYMEPSLFIWIARTFLKPFVVDGLKFFQKEVGWSRQWNHSNPLSHPHSHTHNRTLSKIQYTASQWYLDPVGYSIILELCHISHLWPFALPGSVLNVCTLSLNMWKASHSLAHGFSDLKIGLTGWACLTVKCLMCDKFQNIRGICLACHF